MLPTVQSCKFMIQGGVQYIVISNALTSDYVAGSNATIQFQLFDIVLPPSEAPSGIFQVVAASFDPITQSYYPVNVGNGMNLFQATRAPLSGGSVVPSSFITGLVSTYTFTLQVADPILPGGFIIINIPSEVSFPDP